MSTRYIVKWSWCNLSMCYRETSKDQLKTPYDVIGWIDEKRCPVTKAGFICEIWDYEKKLTPEDQTRIVKEDDLRAWIDNMIKTREKTNV